MKISVMLLLDVKGKQPGFWGSCVMCFGMCRLLLA